MFAPPQDGLPPGKDARAAIDEEAFGVSLKLSPAPAPPHMESRPGSDLQLRVYNEQKAAAFHPGLFQASRIKGRAGR